ncbi:nuclear transport factor 2 family protein [Spirosoma soli]|uniref:Nuclear transport factor 2 family protein n=1 Tax=Spirosoma soli TaxID=1770529 RepID=A0ABW5M8B7_9BACT
MKHLFTIIGLLLTIPVVAQSNDEAAIKVTINLLFDGMRKGDSTQIKNAFTSNATLQTIVKTKEGDVSVRNDDIRKFAASAVKYPPMTLDERLSGMEVKVDAELATAWTPYVFYFQDKKSHCGVNAFTLVKTNGNWHIQNIIDTRRKDTCPDLPKP